MSRGFIQLCKDNPALIPLFGVIGLGMGGAGYYTARLTQGPDVVWDRSNNPYPWQSIRPNEEIKFMSAKQEKKEITDRAHANVKA